LTYGSEPFTLAAMDKPGSKTKLTAIRIDRADLDALAPIAESEGRSVASCIRQAIKEWVRARARKVARTAKPAAVDPAPIDAPAAADTDDLDF
jgi:hypothetical protein